MNPESGDLESHGPRPLTALQNVKLGFLSCASQTGLTGLIRNSGWRDQRLLILCYHGIALRDENRWNPGLFMDRARFQSRMEYLREARCNVLPLGEGVERLRNGSLPKRSVCVTFDDGWHDFHELALPILQRFEIPATVYLTTYYVNFNRPVFDTMLRYLLWRAPGRTFRLDSIIPEPVMVDSRGAESIAAAIDRHIKRHQLSGKAKDELLTAVAGNLGIDYADLLRQRILHLMNPDEVRRVAEAGVDIQLHTHRHRVSRNGALFLRQLDDNREQIRLITGQANPIHFCYPGGNYLPEYETLLADWGAVSATTCTADLCTASSNAYFLPRLLDSDALTSLDFEAWVSGLGAIMPRRSYPAAPGQYLEDWAPPAEGEN